MGEKFGEGKLADMAQLGVQELQTAVLQQEPMPPMEAPAVEAPQASFDAVLADYAAQAPAQDMSMDMDR